MRGVQIANDDGGLDLDDILQLCEKDALRSTWRCRYVEVEGAAMQALEHAADEGLDIPGAEFLELVAGIDRTVEGDFEARRSGASAPWLLIRAIDGTSFEVYSSDRGVLTHVEATFRDVSRAGFADD